MRNISVNREEKYTKGKDTDYNRNVLQVDAEKETGYTDMGRLDELIMHDANGLW